MSLVLKNYVYNQIKLFNFTSKLLFLRYVINLYLKIQTIILSIFKFSNNKIPNMIV